LNIPFIDLKKQYQDNREKLNGAILNVLEHGQYIMGPEVKELEEKLADYIGVKHVVACSSGTDAIVLPLMTKNLTKNDAIFTSPFTFFASAEAISLAGGTPVFVDIDPDTYNLCPTSLEKQITRVQKEGKLNARGVLPIDLFGIAADYDAINPIAKKHGLFVLEDAAQSFGAPYQNKRACALGDIGATSFYPAKPLGCYGDGGAVFTNDTEVYESMVSLRVHGQGKSGDKYDNVRIGLNARMDSIQAAILVEKLKFYDTEIQLRNELADRYNEALCDIVKTPFIPKGQKSVWAQYSIQVKDRQLVCSKLNEAGIPTAIIAENVSKHIFSLPMHPYLDNDTFEYITSTLRTILKT